MNMPRRVQVCLLMSIFFLGLAANEQSVAQDMDTCGEAGSPSCSTERLPEKAETQEPKLLQVGKSSDSELSESSHYNKQEDTITTKKGYGAKQSGQYCSQNWFAMHDAHTVTTLDECKTKCSGDESCQAISYNVVEGNKCVLCEATTVAHYQGWETYVKKVDCGYDTGDQCKADSKCAWYLHLQTPGCQCKWGTEPGGKCKECVHTDGAKKNSAGYQCKDYEGEISKYVCKEKFDTTEWKANEMCCRCRYPVN